MQDWPELERLGRVDPPDPAVLDAAREVLWAAVAEEMLSSPQGEPRRIAEREADQPRQAGRPLPEDPGT